MKIISYFESNNQQSLIEKIDACDWGAAKFLAALLREDRFFEMLGGEGDTYLLMDGDKIVTFLTLTRQDVIRDESMFPWIGFVYTAPEYRGNRYSEKLMNYAENIAKEQGHDHVYVATDHIGLYEKYGYNYLENRVGYWGEESRVLCKNWSKKENTMNIKTERLEITQFTMDMAETVHLNSLDDDNRNFNPDEVFETIEIAQDTVGFLISVYENGDGPLVYPILLNDGTNIGYVQAVPMDDGIWEIGYHVAKAYTGKGYCTEAVNAFLPVIMKQLGISEILGICVTENEASIRVLEKTGFVKEFEGLGIYQDEERSICKYRYTAG